MAEKFELKNRNKAPVEILPPENPVSPGDKPPHPSLPRFSKRRLALAFAIAVLADSLSVVFTLTPPVQWVIDMITAALLFLVLGRQWILLPGLIMEAIPGIYIFPFWLLVVGAVAMWGTARPQMSGTFQREK
jgi:hypothetical protein